ncbi:hypothetical protein JXA32_04295 [Candidatus Sumerlaeota bacterium]|nr:hypothetical protein [Candidatus Sumerlaeota bacterium]
MTFTEVAVVLLIISIMSTMGVLVYRETRIQLRLHEGAQNLKQSMDLARTLAMRRGNFFAVRIHLATGTFWLDEYQLDTTSGTPQLALYKPHVVTEKTLPVLVRVEDASVQRLFDSTLGDGRTTDYAYPYSDEMIDIFFNPSGTSDYAVLHLIQNTKDPLTDTNIYTVKLYSSTARAHVFEKERR